MPERIDVLPPGDFLTTKTRTTRTIVRFASPFSLPGFDAPQPEGDYRVDHDEELLETFSRLVWRRVNTFIYLPAIGRNADTSQMMPVSYADLDRALEKDQNQS